jgi:hypothetical protein
MWWNVEELLPGVNLSLAKKLIGQTATLYLANFGELSLTTPNKCWLEKHIVEYIEHILIITREWLIKEFEEKIIIKEELR